MTSKPASTAARSRTPFRKPSHRCPRTVETSYPTSSRASASGRDSSTSTRNAYDSLSCNLEGGNGLIASHGRKLIQELIERIACLEIVEEVVDRHARADEYELAAHDLGIAVNDLIVDLHEWILRLKRSRGTAVPSAPWSPARTRRRTSATHLRSRRRRRTRCRRGVRPRFRRGR